MRQKQVKARMFRFEISTVLILRKLFSIYDNIVRQFNKGPSRRTPAWPMDHWMGSASERDDCLPHCHPTRSPDITPLEFC